MYEFLWLILNFDWLIEFSWSYILWGRFAYKSPTGTRHCSWEEQQIQWFTGIYGPKKFIREIQFAGFTAMHSTAATCFVFSVKLKSWQWQRFQMCMEFNYWEFDEFRRWYAGGAFNQRAPACYHKRPLVHKYRLTFSLKPQFSVQLSLFYRTTKVTEIIDCSQSPIFREIVAVDVDRWVRRAAILVSWCERNWGEYKMPVGRGNRIKSVAVWGRKK